MVTSVTLRLKDLGGKFLIEPLQINLNLCTLKKYRYIFSKIIDKRKLNKVNFKQSIQHTI